jgi:hypothetical protein
MAKGVRQCKKFAICTNKTSLGLYGKSAEGFREKKSLPAKTNMRIA